MVSVNLTAFVEQASVGSDPFRIDGKGAPYVPIGDGGIVIGLRLGDGVFDHTSDHAAPGACLIHDDPAAGVRALGSGMHRKPSRGADRRKQPASSVPSQASAAKRGGLLPFSARRCCTNCARETRWRFAARARARRAWSEDVTVWNIDTGLFERLPSQRRVCRIDGQGSRRPVPSRLVGNGIGRPTPMWDVDLQLDRNTAGDGAPSDCASETSSPSTTWTRGTMPVTGGDAGASGSSCTAPVPSRATGRG